MRYRLFTLLTVLLLLTALLAPAALAGDTAADDMWTMTPGDILALEGISEDDWFVIESPPFIQYAVMRLDRAYLYAAIYVFRADQLVMYGDTVNSSMQRSALNYDEIYTYFLTELTETYGEPTIEGPQRAIDAANTVAAEALAAENIPADASWELDGMMLYHVHEKTAGEENIYTMFVNEDALYAE